MSIWRRLFGQSGNDRLAPQRLDYLNEALALERQGDYAAALTSYRLALRANPASLTGQELATRLEQVGLGVRAFAHLSFECAELVDEAQHIGAVLREGVGGGVEA